MIMDIKEDNEGMEGLGDLVAKAIKITTGIEAEEDCGCAKRKGMLNRWVPFHKRKKRKSRANSSDST
jgi:hypothetical protein